MEKEFIPYEEALALKELGFDELCFGFYNNADGNVWIKHTVDESIKSIYTGDFEAPLYQQAFRWFREKYNLYSYVEAYGERFIYQIKPHILKHYNEGENYVFDTPEETHLACLKKLIEIIKDKNG